VTIVAGLQARDLGARGSKLALGDSDPAGSIPLSALRVLAAVPRWWAARAAAVGLQPPWLDVERAIEAPAPSLGAVAPDESVRGSWSGERLGQAYVDALSREIRLRHGRHYTPAELSGTLWRMARRALGHGATARRLSGLVQDPASGAGALLLPPLREHLAAHGTVDAEFTIAGLPNVISGVDTDPYAVWLANVVLAAEALPAFASIPARRRPKFPQIVRVGDGLQVDRGQARVVIMNPPYGRVRLSRADRERFGDVLYGHANLYGLFMAAGLEALDDEGVLAALVPTSFMSGLYFTNLRDTLAKKASLREATFVVDRGQTFSGVLQETCMVVFSRKKGRRTVIASMNGHIDQVARVKTPKGAGPWLLPRRADDAPFAAAAISMPLTLREVGWEASTGPLVWNRRKGDLGPTPVRGSVRVVWASDIDGGHLHRDRERDHLRYLKLAGPEDEATMVLAQPAVLVQRTTAPEQRRRLVVAELTSAELEANGGRVVVENHVNVLRPRASAVLSQRVLTQVLKTTTVDRVMRCLCGSVAVSAYELEALPLPAESVLAEWEAADPDDLPRLVAEAYRL
jgi:Eco57I restriction endonuclease.